MKNQNQNRSVENFGHVGETTVVAPGINGKMSEFNAALGLLQLKYIDHAIELRKAIDLTYRAKLANVKGIYCLDNAGEGRSNFAYFPILIRDDYPLTRDELNLKLKSKGIHPRRYFYPLISDFPMYRGLQSAAAINLPVATQASRQVLCLPIYPDLSIDVVEEISVLINNPLAN